MPTGFLGVFCTPVDAVVYATQNEGTRTRIPQLALYCAVGVSFHEHNYADLYSGFRD